ncbi:MAG TPA: serine hydrolase domain-containing protein [Candidatus Tyrphobacter sp.]
MFATLSLAAAFEFTPTTAHRIDAIVETEIHARRTPGIAVGVVASGRLVYARGFGEASLSRRTPVSPGTQFGIGQISEQFTAAAILLLEQDGKLKLDDPVTRFMPDLTVARLVTIRELLDQTSGLPAVSNWAHLVAAANAARPLAPPGTVYAENPLNYLVAGRIVERASGVPLSDFLQQHIFLPLVMDGSFFAGDTGISPTHAVGYTVGRSEFVRTQPWSATRLGGDAGVVSNIYDLAKWDIEFPLLLRVDAVREMFTPGLPGSFERHGMGWNIDQRGGRRFVWQNGEIPGYHAMNAVLPDDHIAVIVLTNADSLHGSAVLPESVAGRILDTLLPPSAQHVDNGVLSRAREWLERLASGRIDRTQLTPSFSAYLSDRVVHDAGIAALGRVISMVPVSSMPSANGGTTYEFLVLFKKGERHYRFAVTTDGKIDFLSFTP